MKINLFLAALAIAGAAVAPLRAAPTASAAIAELGKTADIPFLPPLDTALRYRWEKSVQRSGKTKMSWAVSDLRFEELDEGYRLTVTPVSSGSNETDPDHLALEKRLEELLDIPFVLRLDVSGQIVELENADLYWSTIMRVVREEFERIGSKSEPKIRQALGEFLDMYDKLPMETRLALLTESVQPILEFGDTHTEIGKPIATAIEQQSPFGGTLKRDVVISLTRVADQVAHLSIRSTVPRAELERLTTAFVQKIAKTTPEEQAKMESGIASLSKFRHETISDYRVSLEDGMLEKFRSTETVETAAEGEAETRITSRSLDLME